MIKAVVFDMDGVLFDTERLAQEAWAEVGREVGVDLRDDLIIQCVGLDVNQSRDLFYRELGEASRFDAWRQMRIQKVFERVRREGVPVKKGLIELLNYLREKGIRTALATSSHRFTVDEYFESCPLGDYFDAIISAEAVEKRKPDPAIYLKAVEALEVEPEECIAVEDSPVGILAAYRAGLKPVMIPDLIQPDEDTEKLFFARLDSLDQLIPLLQEDRRKRWT